MQVLVHPHTSLFWPKIWHTRQGSPPVSLQEKDCVVGAVRCSCSVWRCVAVPEWPEKKALHMICC